MSQDQISNDSSRPVSSQAPVVRTPQLPDISPTLTRAGNVTNNVRFLHGANDAYHSMSGKTVGMARKSLKNELNIPGDAQALISGKPVEDDFILEGGMTLEFVKEAGQKGSSQLLNKHRFVVDPKIVV